MLGNSAKNFMYTLKSVAELMQPKINTSHHQILAFHIHQLFRIFVTI